ncbi:MAG TPA: tetratricopeptide repeat protein [Bryobacteraceae bacterium]|jgi:serine/threonine-protein kinase|nr:tetratricopeptide repeat protein [Bryobacteraceae bacterium]
MRPQSTSEGHNGNGDAPITGPEAVQAALEKILASPGFAGSERLSRFLSFAVNETLAGNAEHLKESLIGVRVFGRKPTYDPRIDAVVRTEAVKLRARLRDYYGSTGQDDPLRIDLPKGGYVPQFVVKESARGDSAAVPADRSTADASPSSSSGAKKSLLAGAAMVVVLAAAVIYAVRENSVGPHPGLNSIAVLPFVDLSPAKDQAYFCDGMTEEIIDELTRAGGFRVVARTSSFAFKDKHQDVREIGEKLGVGAVMEGSVRKDGQRLRVTAQLIGVADGYHLWSQTYERELKDVFTVQDEISNAIVQTLRQKLPAPGPAKGQQEDLEAYELYLKGLYHWNRWQKDEVDKGITYFNQALARDPNYAAAWAGLADSYTWLAFYGAAAPTDTMPKARAAAEKAISLNDSLAEAHTSLGYVRALYEWDWPSAQKEFQRAIELNPNSADAHFGYGVVYLAPQGRYDDAVAELRRARDLDPLSLSINTYLGLVLEFDKQPAAAAEQYRKTLDLDPGFAEAHLTLFESYCVRMPKEAAKELEKASRGIPAARIDLSRALLAATQGNRAEALRLIQLSEQRAQSTYVRPTSIASAYVVLGDQKSALKWLEQAYLERDGTLAYLRCSGIFRRLNGVPGYVDLLKRLGLAGAAVSGRS